jgi:hypothetical protein
MFDPNLDSNCTGGVVPQPGAADICVVRYGTIDVGSAATITLVGSATVGRSIAFVADADLTIEGVLDGGAHPGVNGPGGGTYSSGASPTINTNNIVLGGGGAGGATAGGAGASCGEGSASNVGTAGGATDGGTAATNPATLAELVGGASSGAYKMLESGDVLFGGGGGALLLASCDGTVHISGTVSVAGGGGPSGPGFVEFSGVGGGAGGTVVIEAATIDITGSVFANGGGGGQGWFLGASPTAGMSGQDGTLSDTTAAAGGADSFAGGTGGQGGIANASANSMIGAPPDKIDAGPGGGGGSVGFLQTYTPTGVTPTLTPAHASPAFQPNGTVETR